MSQKDANNGGVRRSKPVSKAVSGFLSCISQLWHVDTFFPHISWELA